jgi:hypothetical protein
MIMTPYYGLFKGSKTLLGTNAYLRTVDKDIIIESNDNK